MGIREGVAQLMETRSGAIVKSYVAITCFSLMAQIPKGGFSEALELNLRPLINKQSSSIDLEPTWDSSKSRAAATPPSAGSA